MKLAPNDRHLMFDAQARTLKVFNPAGLFLWGCEARNRTTADGQLGHNGNCPPGNFMLGEPRPKNEVPFGPWFIPVLDYAGNHHMRDFEREGIGIHGGGSGLADPFAPRQGFQVTHGCIRLQNEDLQHLVHLLHLMEMAGGHAYLTVSGTPD
jgi:hypothetical protein